MDDDSDDDGGGDGGVQTRLSEVAAHLAATAERPMRPDVTHWVAEADAVASDVVGADLPRAVVVERLGHVCELLSHVDDTGDDEADEHVTAAKRLAEDVRAELDET